MSQSKGFSLLEVLVATLILSVALGGLAAVFISAARQASVTSHNAIALYHVNSITQALASYVADENAGGGFAGMPEDNAGTGWFRAAVRQPMWQSCTGFAGPFGNCYALSPGLHFIDPAQTSVDFRMSPINGQITYAVTNVAGAPWTAPTKQVVVNANWTEPPPQ